MVSPSPEPIEPDKTPRFRDKLFPKEPRFPIPSWMLPILKGLSIFLNWMTAFPGHQIVSYGFTLLLKLLGISLPKRERQPRPERAEQRQQQRQQRRQQRREQRQSRRTR